MSSTDNPQVEIDSELLSLSVDVLRRVNDLEMHERRYSQRHAWLYLIPCVPVIVVPGPPGVRLLYGVLAFSAARVYNGYAEQKYAPPAALIDDYHRSTKLLADALDAKPSLPGCNGDPLSGSLNEVLRYSCGLGTRTFSERLTLSIIAYATRRPDPILLDTMSYLREYASQAATGARIAKAAEQFGIEVTGRNNAADHLPENIEDGVVAAMDTADYKAHEKL